MKSTELHVKGLFLLRNLVSNLICVGAINSAKSFNLKNEEFLTSIGHVIAKSSKSKQSCKYQKH